MKLFDEEYKAKYQEINEAFEYYKKVKDNCSSTGNWEEFSNMFVEDAFYHEHAYGIFQGREAIKDYIVKVMAPFPNMTFPIEWSTIDVENNSIIWQLYNTYPTPPYLDKEKKIPFGFPNISRLVYSHKDKDGTYKFSEEQDWYNPAGDAKRVTSAWIKAGGKFKTAEQLFMQHDKKKPSKL